MKERNDEHNRAMGCDWNGPKFSVYHPNGKGTGAAIMLAFTPASNGEDGYYTFRIAHQRSVGNVHGNPPVFPTFDWDNAIEFTIDFSLVCKMLQVFRGECETLDDGKGVYIRHRDSSIRVVLRHVVDPVQCYSIEVYKDGVTGNDDLFGAVRINLNTWEALGVSLAMENNIGAMVFGVPNSIIGKDE